MGIRSDFLIKHVRPIGDGFELIADDQLTRELRGLGVADQHIGAVLAHWAAVADLPATPQNAQAFAENAAMIAGARWSEHGWTDLSTVVYLNGPLLEQLSRDCATRPSRTFDWVPLQDIPIAVTIDRATGGCTTVFTVRGMRIATDASGNCCHFEGLL